MTIDSGINNTRLFRVRSWADHYFEVTTNDGRTLGVKILVCSNYFGEVDAVVIKVSMHNAAVFEFFKSQTTSIGFMEHLEHIYGHKGRNLPGDWELGVHEFFRFITLKEISKALGYDLSNPGWDDVTRMINKTPYLVRVSDLVWRSKDLCTEVVDSPLRSLLPIIAELTDELDAVAREWLANQKE